MTALRLARLEVESADVGPPDAVQVDGGGWSGPPQPQRLGVAVAAAGQPGHLHPDDGGLHDGHGSARVAVGALVGVQPVPGMHLDVAVLVVVAAVHRVWCWPGGRVGAGEPVAVAAGPATLSRP
jgi:hypothetical protein